MTVGTVVAFKRGMGTNGREQAEKAKIQWYFGVSVMKENYYFAAMSLINAYRLKAGEELPRFEVVTESGKKHYGFHTNEIPTYYYMEKLAEQGQLFDHMEFFVTRECMEKHYTIEGREMTTCEYLVECFRKELENLRLEYTTIDHRLSEQFDGSASQYLDKVLHYSLIENTGDNGELYRKLNEALKRDLTDTRIYMDMTGGSRLSQIVSLLLMRIMENLGAEVATIIYVDITQDAKLVDATNNYRICRLIEEKDNDVNFALEAKKLGIEKEVNLEEVKLVESLKADTLNSIKGAGEQTISRIEAIEKKESGQSLVDRKRDQNVRRIRENISINNPFTKLKRFETEKLITGFYEEVAYAFYAVGLIAGREKHIGKDERKRYSGNGAEKQQREIKELIKQMLFYYILDNRGNEVRNGQLYFHSVIGESHRLLQYLSGHMEISPIQFWRSRCDVENAAYDSYYNRYPVFPGKLLNKKLIEEYQMNHGSAYGGNASFIDKWYHYQTVYANYGFPFHCVCGSEFYPEIRQYYLDKLSELMEELDVFHEQMSNDEYRTKLEQTEKKLTERIPFRVDCDKIHIDAERLKKLGLEKTSFMKELAERMEKVRSYRNDIAHKTGGADVFLDTHTYPPSVF